MPISYFFIGSDKTATPEKKEGKPEEKPVHEDSGEEKDAKPEKEQAKEESKEAQKEATKEEKEGKEKDKKKEVKAVLVKEPVTAKLDWLGVVPIPVETLASYKAKIKELNDHDERRARREAKLNALESFVFNMVSKLDEAPYAAAATQEEADKIREACSKVRKLILRRVFFWD